MQSSKENPDSSDSFAGRPTCYVFHEHATCPRLKTRHVCFATRRLYPDVYIYILYISELDPLLQTLRICHSCQAKMFKKPLLQPISVAIFICFISINLFSLSAALNDEEFSGHVGPVVKKDQRKSLVVTEYGEISVIEIADGIKGPHHIQLITLEPNSLFLPVLLHADMVFYVHTGTAYFFYKNLQFVKFNFHQNFNFLNFFFLAFW